MWNVGSGITSLKEKPKALKQLHAADRDVNEIESLIHGEWSPIVNPKYVSKHAYNQNISDNAGCDKTWRS